MNRLILILTISVFTLPSFGTTRVHGYTKKDGTYVSPHSRTGPNGTQRDNWSSKGNINPNTGKEGTREPQK